MNSRYFSFIVIGAGAGGLVVAIGLAKAGKNVLLIERAHFGGDCTNFGCIPSKSIISSAEIAQNIKDAKEFGIELESQSFLAEKALERTRNIVQEIRSHEEPSSLEKLGVKTLTAEASFVDAHTIKVKKKNGSEEILSAKKIVIAAGSAPFIPSIEGLKDTPFLTNETIFDLKKVPESMIIIGAGPIGSELAQAYNRLGVKVTLIVSKSQILPREPSDIACIAQNQFLKEGMNLCLNHHVKKVTNDGKKFIIIVEKDGQDHEISSEQVLISVGRRSNLQSLNLDSAKIRYNEKGIIVDDFLKTSQKHIYAIGDITGPPYFTHLAESHGRAVLTSLLAPFQKKWPKQAIPRVTFTDPEIASIGLSIEEVKKQYSETKIAIYDVDFKNIDRPICQGRQEGKIRIITKKWSSKILGATIVGPRAGEMLSEISLAMIEKIPLRKIATLIHAYPTYGQGIRKASDLWLIQTILPNLKRLFGK